MSSRRPLAIAALWVFLTASASRAQTNDNPEVSVEAIAEAARSSVVVILSTDRTGKKRGIGSGFLVRDGLVATNFHVIGHRRPFAVRLSSGETVEPRRLVAVDRDRDLALVEIAKTGLSPIELGDSDALRVGQTVVTIGNPLGLEFSVSRGVVSAFRNVEKRPMVQLALAIEPGSSGSPVLDLDGRAVGIVALKSADSMGFAVPVNALKWLVENPRPREMESWLTIGALDVGVWKTLMGGRWSQRAGQVAATGAGKGFAGRMLCLRVEEPPAGSFEVETDVKLEDESGAAGLVFASDSGFSHYGFYPTAGSVRLTKFEGPDVFSWRILRTVETDAYRPGEWNRVGVRVEEDSITCLVNGEAVIHEHDTRLRPGRVGFVKFRQPSASFRRFRVARELPRAARSEDLASKVGELAAGIRGPRSVDCDTVERIAALGEGGTEWLGEEARSLERRALGLRELGQRVHRRRVEQLLNETLDGEEENIDLLRAALLIARLDNPEVDVEAYTRSLDRMAGEVRGDLPTDATDSAKLDALVRYLFSEKGFHGSHGFGSDPVEYYHRSNSYINEVLDDREGIPITLAVVFIETARRIGLPVVGVGIPRHFIVMYRPTEDDETLIDVFSGGRFLTRADAAELSGVSLEERHFQPASKRSIVIRMLRNLFGLAQSEGDSEGMLRYVDAIIAVAQEASTERLTRAQLRLRGGDSQGAAEDLDWLLERRPENLDIEQIYRLRRSIRE